MGGSAPTAVGVRRASRPTSSLAVAALVAAALVPTAGATSRQTVLPTLYVEYTMSCTFRITDDQGRSVGSIAPGTYQVSITSPVAFSAVDLSGIHDMTACKGFADFRLTGPGVNLTTTLQDGDEDKDQFTETFQAGSTYTAVDLNQPAVARVVFSTTTLGSPTAPSTPFSPGAGSTPGGHKSVDIVGSARAPFRGTLQGRVDAAGKLTLSFNGKKVSSLKAGRYEFVVTDQTRNAAFSVQRGNRSGVTVTGLPFVGRRSQTINLVAGQWTFYSSITRKSGFKVVA